MSEGISGKTGIKKMTSEARHELIPMLDPVQDAAGAEI